MEIFSINKTKENPKMKRSKTKKTIAAALAVIACALAFSSCTMTTSPANLPVPSLLVEPENTQPRPTESVAAEATTQIIAEPTDEASEQKITPVEPFEPPKLYINTLTGLYTNFDAANLRPVAAVVDNSSGALPHQSGLIGADIIYETVTSPGTTRFLAIYSDYREMPDVCNLRAARAHDVKIAAMYNAVVISHGGHTDKNPEYDFFAALGELYGDKSASVNSQRDLAWTAQNAEKFGTVRYFENGYRNDLKYETVLTSSAIEYAAEQRDIFGGTAENPIKISSGAAAGENASGVTISFSASGLYSPLEKKVSLRYSLSDGMYLRFEDGRPHVDSQSGEQLKFSNVIVLKTDIKYIEGDSDIDPLTADVSVYGSGTGYCLCGGKCATLVWVNTKDGGMKLYTPSGELELPAGNTYVAFVDRNNDSAITIE